MSIVGDFLFLCDTLADGFVLYGRVLDNPKWDGGLKSKDRINPFAARRASHNNR